MSDPILLTPGPLTTSAATRDAMLRDWGSWDGAFNALTASVCTQLRDLVHGQASHVCVPLQGSGTFAVEATLGTLVPRTGKVLVPNNGAYCQRILRILKVTGRASVELPFDEREPIDPGRIDAVLAADPAISHVALVHCETGTGILNPLDAIVAICARHGRRLIVDAMSSFGALPIDLRTGPIDAVIAASGKCLEGVPGMGFVVIDRHALEQADGQCHSLALDLHDQWRYMERTGQWRFTPPTHVLAALAAALAQHAEEGGPAARRARYEANRDTLVRGMCRIGFEPLLDERVQSPIIVTFVAPIHEHWHFGRFYERMRARGFVLYPGKLTRIDTFRVGCIGAINPTDIDRMLQAVMATLSEMQLSLGQPALDTRSS
jgi:2-aminoethylphosphonate-pyruvate transaminase